MNIKKDVKRCKIKYVYFVKMDGVTIINNKSVSNNVAINKYKGMRNAIFHLNHLNYMILDVCNVIISVNLNVLNVNLVNVNNVLMDGKYRIINVYQFVVME